MKKKLNNIAIAITAAFVILTAGCSDNGTDEPDTFFNDAAVTSNSLRADTEAAVNDTAITTKTTADTTSATVKDSENNSIKPNSDNGASDEEVAFLANSEQLVNSVEQIEELKRLLMEIEGVTDVQVYNSADDSQNIEHQITEGKAAKGTIVKVFYDNGESWVEYTKQ